MGPEGGSVGHSPCAPHYTQHSYTYSGSAYAWPPPDWTESVGQLTPPDNVSRQATNPALPPTAAQRVRAMTLGILAGTLLWMGAAILAMAPGTEGSRGWSNGRVS